MDEHTQTGGRMDERRFRGFLRSARRVLSVRRLKVSISAVIRVYVPVSIAEAKFSFTLGLSIRRKVDVFFF